MAESHIVLDYEQLTALAVRLDDRADEITQVTLHDLEQDIRTAARVASAHAHWRFALAELAASLPAGTHARNEILNLLGKDKIESAEPTTFAILYDIPAGSRRLTKPPNLSAQRATTATPTKLPSTAPATPSWPNAARLRRVHQVRICISACGSRAMTNSELLALSRRLRGKSALLLDRYRVRYRSHLRVVRARKSS